MAMVAVLKAGAAFVALDLAQLPPRTAAMLKLVDAKVVMVSSARQHLFGQFLEESAERKIIMLLDDKMIARSSAEEIGAWKSSSPVCPNKPAYVIFTSGAQGLPRASSLSTGRFVRVCPDMQRHSSWTSGPVSYSLSPTYTTHAW